MIFPKISVTYILVSSGESQSEKQQQLKLRIAEIKNEIEIDVLSKERMITMSIR